MSDLSLEVITNVFYALNATSASQLDSFWTVAQLYQWCDEELKRMSRKSGIWVDRAALKFTGKPGPLSCPAGHLATHHVDLNGATLRPKNVQILDAAHADWEDQQNDPPVAYLMDYLGPDTIRLFPTPYQAGTLYFLAQFEPTAVTNAQTSTPLSPMIDDQLALRAIAEARRTETDAQMPEVVDFCESVIGLYSDLIGSYFGSGM